MTTYRSIGVTVKSDFPLKDVCIERLLTILDETKATVLVDKKRMPTAKAAKKYSALSPRSPIDLLVVLGGDGSILRTVREYHHFNVPILGINAGHVGFLAELSINEIENVLPQLLSGKGVIETRTLLDVKVGREGKKVFEGIALNEAVIAQGAIARLIDLQTSVSSEPLTTFHADGLIVSTPTGSTAYNLAAGGPIVHPGLPALILTPINPHSFSQKPIVLPGHHIIDVEVLTTDRSSLTTEVGLSLDGQSYFSLRPFDVICLHLHEHPVRFLRRKQDTFFATLRTKLKWGDSAMS